MPIAGNITLVTVSGEYVDYEGAPIAGQVIFRLPTTLRNELADQIVVPSSYAATLNAFGQFSIVLPATDDPQFHQSFVYTVEESFPGGRVWQTTLPENVTSVKMSDLVPAYTGGAFTELAAYQAYVVEEQAVTTQEGYISYAPAGVVLASTYGNVAFVYDTYTEVIADRATYALLISTPVVAETADILPLDDIRVNLVTNPSFETNTTGWSSLGGSTIARITTDSRFGSASVRTTYASAASNQGITTTFACTTGQSYTFSAYLKNTAGITRQMYTQIGWPGGGSFSTSPITNVAAGSWVRITATGTAPSTGTANLYVVTGTTGQAASGQTALVDGLLLEQSASLGEYFDGSFEGFWTGTAHASISRNATVPSYATYAQYWADLAIEQAEELFPHPFIFTGSLGVER